MKKSILFIILMLLTVSAFSQVIYYSGVRPGPGLHFGQYSSKNKKEALKQARQMGLGLCASTTGNEHDCKLLVESVRKMKSSYVGEDFCDPIICMWITGPTMSTKTRTSWVAEVVYKQTVINTESPKIETKTQSGNGSICSADFPDAGYLEAKGSSRNQAMSELLKRCRNEAATSCDVKFVSCYEL